MSFTYPASISFGSTGLSATVEVSTNGGAYGAAQNLTEEASTGVYSLNLSLDYGNAYKLRFHDGAGNYSTETIFHPVDPATVDQVEGYTDTLETSATSLASAISTLQGIVNTIKAKTDNLPAAPAAVGDIPTTAQIATVVWDKATSALTTVGSIGKLLVDKMAFITSGVTLTVTNPVASSGDISEIIAGDDYYTADGRALQFSFIGQPDWTGATPVLYVNTPTPIEVTGTVSNAGTATQTLSFELSSSETARGTIPDGRDLETYSFEISVTLSNGHETTPRRGKATFKRQLG